MLEPCGKHSLDPLASPAAPGSPGLRPLAMDVDDPAMLNIDFVTLSSHSGASSPEADVVVPHLAVKEVSQRLQNARITSK
jgi:hypothetical protein